MVVDTVWIKQEVFNKMKKETITSTRTVYSDKCSNCKKKIKAFSETNLEYNMRLHKEKCLQATNEVKRK